MTQEEKQLLIKDLCARLPYGTYVHHKNCPNTKFKVIAVFDDGRIGVTENGIQLTPTSIDECKPYLRPMISMTVEEETLFRCELPVIAKTDAQLVAMRMELFLKGHLDFNHLIEKGLALEAPENMYKNE